MQESFREIKMLQEKSILKKSYIFFSGKKLSIAMWLSQIIDPKVAYYKISNTTLSLCKIP